MAKQHDQQLREGFAPSELKSSYPEFKRLTTEPMTKELREWLARWELWDFACSPMQDNERKFIRYGHYLGWFHRKYRGDE